MVIGIYHKGCIDGTMAAAILHKKYPEAVTYPLRHHYSDGELQPILKAIQHDTNVYILDCALGINEILEKKISVTVIDHHISVHAQILGLVEKNPSLNYIFDNSKSGASLAWSVFFPNEKIPRVVELVEDHDLWTCKYGEETKIINSYLMLYPDKPLEVQSLLDEIPEDIYKSGQLLSKYIDMLVQQFTEIKPLELTIGDNTVYAYNVTTAQSQVGDILSSHKGSAVCLFMIQGEHVKLSFRSKDEHDPSALTLATRFGGGGHKNASGAVISLSDFLNSIKK